MNEPQWLNEVEAIAWRRFAAVMGRLPSALDAQLQRDASLTHFAYFTLAMLSESPARALRMSELAAISNSSPSRLSHTVARLEERGWVRRQRAEEDGRGQVAELTDAGFAALVEMAPGHVGAVRHYVFSELSCEQVQQLSEICALMLKQIDPDGGQIPRG